MQQTTPKRAWLAVALAVTVSVAAVAQDVTLPKRPGSVKFAVIGDSGTGDANQYRVAQRLVATRNAFPYEFVLMLGDNIYDGQSPRDYEDKFERPYKPLLEARVKFYAALGNHDSPNQRLYKHFNMGGRRYYTFKPRDGVRFFALDSNYMDKEQLQWLQRELPASGSEWKIAFFHHPIYSSGRTHGSNLALRDELEPLFLKHGVNVVLSGHDHFYERIKPQQGIQYFVSGASAKLRRGDIRKDTLVAKGFDQGYHFMVMEVHGNELHYQVLSDQGQTVDAGVIVQPRARLVSRVESPASTAAVPRP